MQSCFEEGKCANSCVHEYKYLIYSAGTTLSMCIVVFEEKEILTRTNIMKSP